MMIDKSTFFSVENMKLIQEMASIPLDKAVLKLSNSKNKDKQQIVNQISGLIRIKDKLPTWKNTPKILFPPTINLEQCSSEITANYKSNICQGNLIVDLTGGFGVDTFYFSTCFESVYYVEKNENLFEMASLNFEELGIDNITLFNQDCSTFLEIFSTKIAKEKVIFYLDPSRRDNSNKKLVSFNDLEPNVLQVLPTLFTFSNTILLKASPMHDIDLAIQELGFVAEVHVVSIKNECKELLFVLKNLKLESISIHTINYKNDITQHFSFTRKIESESQVTYSFPLTYLYEPNASILKSGAFKSIAAEYSLYKISPNTHLYTSQKLEKDFPGKVFEVLENIHLQDILSYLPDNQVNVICRNYPMSAQEIKNKYKIRDGGNLFLLNFSNTNQKASSYLAKKST